MDVASPPSRATPLSPSSAGIMQEEERALVSSPGPSALTREPAQEEVGPLSGLVSSQQEDGASPSMVCSPALRSARRSGTRHSVTRRRSTLRRRPRISSPVAMPPALLQGVLALLSHDDSETESEPSRSDGDVPPSSLPTASPLASPLRETAPGPAACLESSDEASSSEAQEQDAPRPLSPTPPPTLIIRQPRPSAISTNANTSTNANANAVRQSRSTLARRSPRLTTRLLAPSGTRQLRRPLASVSRVTKKKDPEAAGALPPHAHRSNTTRISTAIAAPSNQNEPPPSSLGKRKVPLSQRGPSTRRPPGKKTRPAGAMPDFDALHEKQFRSQTSIAAPAPQRRVRAPPPSSGPPATQHPPGPPTSTTRVRSSVAATGTKKGLTSSGSQRESEESGSQRHTLTMRHRQSSVLDRGQARSKLASKGAPSAPDENRPPTKKKAFNLAESLARPLTYKPKRGRIIAP